MMMWRSALLAVSMVAGVAAAQDPAVRVTLNSNNVYDRGDRGRVFVKVHDDGYVVVLQVAPDGHVRPLYPLNPTDENHIDGGTKFEVRSRDDHEAFQVVESSGSGTIYAAYSAEPFKFDDFMTGDNWDNNAFPDSGVAGHEEAVLTDLVQHMATGQHFDYDLASYRITPAFHRHEQAYADGGSGGYGDGGWAYYPPPVVLANWGATPWWYGPSYYDPFFYDPFYDPYFYGPRYGFGFGGFGGFGFGFGGCFGGCGFYGYRGGPVVVGRPGWGYGNRYGVGYGGRYGGVVAVNRTFVGGSVGYRGRAGTTFTNVTLGRRTYGGASVGTRTVFPQGVAARGIQPNLGRAVYRAGPTGFEGSRPVATRVPSVDRGFNGEAGAGHEFGPSRTSVPNGSMGRAPMPVAHRVEPSAEAPHSGGGGGGGAPHGGGTPHAAPHSGGSSPHSGGGGHGGGAHMSSFGGGHGGGGGGHHR